VPSLLNPSPRGDRRAVIADAAIRVLASAGGRGLTHRAVDRELRLPVGSTGNYFPTRAELLAVCAERLAQLDEAEADAASITSEGSISVEDAGARIGAFLRSRLQGAPRERQLARLELLLEAGRTESLALLFAALRTRFIGMAEALLAATGVIDAEGGARVLVAAFDGALFDQLLYPLSAATLDAVEEHFASLIVQVAAFDRTERV
jgi:Tetracyclin repressor-like, C-terminal domain